MSRNAVREGASEFSGIAGQPASAGPGVRMVFAIGRRIFNAVAAEEIRLK